MKRPDCMADAEFARWSERNDDLLRVNRADCPCRDCPLEWHIAQVMLGTCDGTPLAVGERKPIYSSTARIARQRAQWRDYRRRKRAMA